MLRSVRSEGGGRKFTILLLPLLLSGWHLNDAPFFFEDHYERSGISFKYCRSAAGEKYLIETMGGGVGLLDYDVDGILDIFFANGSHLPQGLMNPKEGRYSNRLYRGLGNGEFEDTTQVAGLAGRTYAMGVATGDYNNDGYVDLYVTGFRANSLYRNNGDGTFSDVTQRAGVGGGMWSASAAFLDYDRDGHLDLYVTRYLNWDLTNHPYCGKPRPGYRAYCSPDRFEGVADILYHNEGDGTFADVSVHAGIARPEGKGLGVAFADYDGDGWPDIFVANDRVPSYLFRNRGDGTFDEVAVKARVAYNGDGAVFGGMGVDFQDCNNDGFPDLFVTTLTGDMFVLFENNGDGTFDDVRFSSGIAGITLPYTGWGTGFFDFDNDGRKDLFAANSHVMDNVELYLSHVGYAQRPLLLRNLAGGMFGNVGGTGGRVFAQALTSRGTAFGDLDNDGDQDILVSNLDNSPNILLNQGQNQHHWLSLDLVGRASNRFGIGARVKVSAGVQTQYRTVTTAGSYLSANDRRPHFGLGEQKQVQVLEVWWPSGQYQELEHIPVDRILRVTEPNANSVTSLRPATQQQKDSSLLRRR